MELMKNEFKEYAEERITDNGKLLDQVKNTIDYYHSLNTEEDYEDMLDDLEELVTDLIAIIGETSNTIDEQNSRIESLEETLEDAENEAAQYDAEVAFLQQKLAEATA